MSDDNSFFTELSIFLTKLSAILVPLMAIWGFFSSFKLEIEIITKLIATIGYLLIIIVFYIYHTNKKLSKEIKKLEAIEKEREVERNESKK
ncbi:MAG: hypothetical protein KAI53_00660 [Candidatus Aenigmarchaeota archaeon]|nr:hypothetical protein [Candidatus Aenigmarchaeota archaeon]